MKESKYVDDKSRLPTHNTLNSPFKLINFFLLFLEFFVCNTQVPKVKLSFPIFMPTLPFYRKH